MAVVRRLKRHNILHSCGSCILEALLARPVPECTVTFQTGWIMVPLPLTSPPSWATFGRQGATSESIMAKPVTQKIRLASSAGTGYYYVTKKNPRNLTEKLVLKKYDPVVKRHVEFKETKIK